MDPFDQKYYGANRQDRDRPALIFYQRLARKFFCPGPVLDFGCGCGYFLRRLSRFFPAQGIEVSEYGRRKSQEINPASPIYENLDTVPRGNFSGVTALHVFEHIEDECLNEVLRSLQAVMRSDGKLLCAIPQLGGKGHRLKGEAWAGFRDSTHVNLKTRAEWEDLFTERGFSVLKAGTDGLWDFPYSALPRLFDKVRYASGTALQFFSGSLILPPDSGESIILLLGKSEQ